MQVTETEHSIKDFFSNNVTSRLSNNYNLETAQVGRDKCILDNVDISLPIVAVLSSFGPYLKYIVSGIPNCCVALLNLIEVDVRDDDCHDVVEKLYYSAKFDPICVYRGKDEPYTDKNNYRPQCHSCKDKPAIKKKA